VHAAVARESDRRAVTVQVNGGPRRPIGPIGCFNNVVVVSDRCLSVSWAARKDKKYDKDRENSANANEGWLKKLLVRRIEPTKEQHSRMLSDKEVIYELQTHNVRPDSTDGYVKN